MILSLGDIPLISSRSRGCGPQSRSLFWQTTFIPFVIRLVWYCSNVGLRILENVISIIERNWTLDLWYCFPMVRGRFKTFFARQRVDQWVKYYIMFTYYILVGKLLVQGVLNVIVEYSSIPNSLSLIHFYLGMSLSLTNKQLRPLINYFSLFAHLTEPSQTRWNSLIAKVIAAN